MLITPEVKENIDIYEEILFQLCKLFIELGVSNNPLKIYETFRYMYQNGYLSIEEYSNQIPSMYKDLEGNGFIPMDATGTFLFTNYGVCRHTSDFLSHIYSGLGYDNSQLFTYHPDIRIRIKNCGTEFLTNKDAQEYIDFSLSDFNYFEREERHIARHLGDISIMVDYFPSPPICGHILSNHTMNIVRNKDERRVHIVDTRYHSVGERISKKRVRLNNCGLTHVNYVQTNVRFHTYYGTDYRHGLELLKEKTEIDKDVLSSILYRDFCKKFIEKYKEFKRQNQKGYMQVTNNYQKLLKRIE